ncbi:uncharacterized protein LOC122508153 [Leptopilina heterotoma]|uniref:uncharacterized protein LOC122508153 n=1 Tax=Leptopilina heterotoma TaxID=63436 RepID=UPI001CA8830A|nr:uncharacterized protein LOC122508153 [Leptopilina heterotoma]
MNLKILLFFIFAIFVLYVTAETIEQQTLPASSSLRNEKNLVHTRSKRTLFLKKKVLGAGLLGFGLGVVKGYKYGYHRAPEVHHVYLAPPPSPVKYIEYVEKPVFVDRIIEKPVFKEHVESWHPEPPSTYGAW